ncbi:MAG: phosphate ABC transporter ATP-binding protein [Bacteroidetes bacterium QH_6_64_77]|jgi:phosphate transport system ATP-binding protein|nr:MAG: phosphate ABC transporter ATP-binding protein [Bacteroidetes bacterium QH_1_64_81]PSQ72196.1 MAG: phosphate ABC transporter ATP-binding protein [Bacteroidetes bacterium QH_6_64_77]PSQ90988.1 MAG: phosphate ABC transporter ATP-binding protein [Bacteroidetes bacterium QS_4_64_154]
MSTDEPTDDAPPSPAPSPASADEATPNGRPENPRDDVPPADPSPSAEPTVKPKLNIDDLHFWYGDNHALQGITMDVQPNKVTALIGPSGCGKSTLLRCLNRMNELIQGTTLEGTILVDGQDIYAEDTDPVMVRRRVGMVFQKPNPFPKTIYKNVAWGAEINGYTGDVDALVERSLRQAALWDEVKDRLHGSALDLSGGQQQRLCIARTLAVQPDVVLMDEPASALDPIATSKVEETITELKKDYTIVIVTHNMQQASRISDETAFLYMGRLIEMNPTDQLFTRPEKDRTEAYVTGRFG